MHTLKKIEPTLQNSWKAKLALEFSKSAFGTQLTKTQRSGPLNVQRAFFPEGNDCAHVYILHPPAGIVSGDELIVNVLLNSHSHALITTPGGNRFYKARDNQQLGISKQIQRQKFEVQAQAKCENFPLETIVYQGADGINCVDIHLHSDSAYIGWDITCLGLPSSNQPFTEGSYTQINRVYCDERLIFHDRMAANQQSGVCQHVAGLNGFHTFGTLLAYLPRKNKSAYNTDNCELNEVISQIRDKMSQLGAEHKVSITQIKDLLVARYLFDSAEECKSIFIEIWMLLRPIIINKQATKPRIWYT